MAYEINYNDKRFTEVESQKNAALKESEKTYDQMITGSDKYFNQQTEALKQYGDKQSQLQQEKTDFAIEKIEQQKEQARKDYLKEQSAAYGDWLRQSDDYGTNAEKMAASGLAHTGYSESSQVSMYNTYQNRVATARESYMNAVLNYDNAIKDAQLQNNSVLAEIAYETLQKSLELSLQGFQYKNQLVLEKANAKREIDNTYYSRYQNVLSQINTENALAEQIRQYNESMAEQKRQYNESLALQKEQFEWQKKNSSVSSSRSSGGSSGGSGGGGAKIDKSPTGGVGAAVKASSDASKKNAALKAVKAVGTEKQAKALLKGLGIKADTPLLSSATWNKAKRTGELASEFEGINSYAEYVKMYCSWAINNYM